MIIHTTPFWYYIKIFVKKTLFGGVFWCFFVLSRLLNKLLYFLYLVRLSQDKGASCLHIIPIAALFNGGPFYVFVISSGLTPNADVLWVEHPINSLTTNYSRKVHVSANDEIEYHFVMCGLWSTKISLSCVIQSLSNVWSSL